MAITLNEVAVETFLTRAGVLAVVGFAITVVVYGAVALIVKMDDIGLALSRRDSSLAQTIGRGLVAAMPRLLVVLSFVGTVAMLWVGGGILLHGTHELGFHGLYDATHGIEHAVESVAGGALGWLTYAALSALLALVVGGIIAVVLHKVFKFGDEAGAH